MAAAHGKKEGKCYNCEKRGHFKSEHNTQMQQARASP
ncbi:hypothetical protein F443_22456, partial [Phytophthora nicotianae P1569]